MGTLNYWLNFISIKTNQIRSSSGAGSQTPWVIFRSLLPGQVWKMVHALIRQLQISFKRLSKEWTCGLFKAERGSMSSGETTQSGLKSVISLFSLMCTSISLTAEIEISGFGECKCPCLLAPAFLGSHRATRDWACESSEEHLKSSGRSLLREALIS